MTRTLNGGCLCGDVRYRVRDEFEYALNCHCSQCRKATGSAFKSLAGISAAKLELARGAEALLIYGDVDRAHDVRCGRCGSLLYSIVRDGAYAHVAMGSLDEAPQLAPQMHIFTESKARWHDIADELPRNPGFPP